MFTLLFTVLVKCFKNAYKTKWYKKCIFYKNNILTEVLTYHKLQ